MRICANENIPEDCVIRLRQSGHDVLWIRQTSAGCSDVGVMDRALAEDRLLLTFDKDFGHLVCGAGGKASRGVVLLRISQASSIAVAEQVAAVPGLP